MAVICCALHAIFWPTNSSDSTVDKPDAAIERGSFLVNSSSAGLEPWSVKSGRVPLEQIAESPLDVIEDIVEYGRQGFAAAPKVLNHGPKTMGPCKSVEKDAQGFDGADVVPLSGGERTRHLEQLGELEDFLLAKPVVELTARIRLAPKVKSSAWYGDGPRSRSTLALDQ